MRTYVERTLRQFVGRILLGQVGLEVALVAAAKLSAPTTLPGDVRPSLVRSVIAGLGSLSHPRRPGSLWPPGSSMLRVETVAYWAAFIVSVGAGLAIISAAAYLRASIWRALDAHKRRRALRPFSPPKHLLAPLVVMGPTPNRFILGRLDAQSLLATEDPGRPTGEGPFATGGGPLLILGPDNSMRAERIASSIAAWQGPAIVITANNALLALVAGTRRGGPVDVYDPINASGRATLSWTPLVRARTAIGAQEVAGLLSSVADERESGKSLRHVAALLWIACCQDKGLHDVAYWAAENAKQQLDRVEPFLRATIAGDDPSDAVHADRVRTELRALADLLRRDANPVLATSRASLSPWRDSRTERWTSTADETAVRSRRTLCVVTSHDPSARAIMRAYLHNELPHVLARSIGGPRLLVVADESANLTLDQLLWLTRQDVQLVTVSKSFCELGDRGRRIASFLAAQRVVLRLPGPYVGYGDDHLAAAALRKTDLASYNADEDRRPSLHRFAAWPCEERALLLSNGRAFLLDPA